MSKSILTIDTPKGCVFCPLAKMHGFNAFHNYSAKQETVMNRQPYMGITCPFCNGIRYIYNLTDDEVLTYKHEECPLKECKDQEDGIDTLEQEPIVKNDKVDCKHIDCNNCVNHKYCDYEPTAKNDLSSGLEKNSKKLEKDFGELDCISRKAVLDAIDSKAWEFCDYLISKGRNDEQKPVSHFADNLRECVREEIPSVTPQEPRWIPASEKLPEEDGEYYATVYDTSENHKYMDIAELEDGIWQYKDYVKVLAWMPLPKAYSEVEE